MINPRTGIRSSDILNKSIDADHYSMILFVRRTKLTYEMDGLGIFSDSWQ